jgi:hypothetical protein
VLFQHKSITNPTVSPQDKLMLALANCKEALAKCLKHSPTQQMQELKTVMDNAPRKLQQQQQQTTTVPRVDQVPQQSRTVQIEQPAVVPRVETSSVASTRNTRTVTLARTKLRKRHSMAHLTAPIHNPSAPPALSTESKVKAAAQAPTATARRSTRSARPSRLHQPTRSSRGKQRHNFLQRFQTLEREVEQARAVMDVESGKMLNHRQLNEFGRLAQGVGGRIKGTDTMRFINENEVPKTRQKDITYGSFVCNVRPEKVEEPNRTRFTVGGNKINYPGEVATPTAEMLVAKILFNSVISTPNAKFMTIDISNFYLNTPLKRPEYLRVRLADLPEEIVKEYRLAAKVNHKGFVFIKVSKGMYGQPQAGLLAINELLEKRLNQNGYYHQSKLIPGLWKHEPWPIMFTLVVDDFGVQYVGKEHAQHLESVLKAHYKIKADWTGTRYIEIHLAWDYTKRQVHLYMPGYVQKALQQFQHKRQKKQNQPFPHTPIKYGAKKQYAKQPSTAPAVTPDDKKFIQRVCGKFLFYGRAINGTVLTPISAIASQSAQPTTEMVEHTKQLLDYLATQEDAVLTYNKSDMILAVHSDASYLSEPGARSRAGGHFFLSTNAEIPPNNGAILNISHVIKHVMSSATEAKLGALYIMAREAVYVRMILEEMGHKQPATPVQTDNAMAKAVINAKIQPKKQTKAMDMRFHWLRDRQTQQQFKFYWRPGKQNYADYCWTKHHSAAHHVNVRKEFLTTYIVLEMLRMKQTAAKAA